MATTSTKMKTAKKAETPASLRRYQEKRDFNKTAEPSGDDPLPKDLPKKPAKGARFLIQKHDASRLHYDFRLEIDGVLKSWAVPKGPSLDPKDRRLAVEVEDHPVGYGAFEGTIPHGEYGGGTVLMWDHGTFTVVDGEDALAQWQAGKLAIELEGQRLHGRFRLVRMPKRGNEKQVTWLLMKGKDEHVVDGGDVDHLPDTSVKTGRSLDEIAAATDAVWRSNREPKEPAPAKKAATANEKKEKKKKAATTKKTASKTPTTKQPEPEPETAASPKDVVVAGVVVTNADRRLFGDGSLVTKGLLARYVEVIAPLILPYIEGRPLSVVRCPQGALGECFFQKHVGKGMPEGIAGLDVDDNGEQWVVVKDVAGLVGLVQMGGIELHPWGARPWAPEEPDRIIMDVDPGDDLPWSRVVDAATQLRQRLGAHGLETFVKSTGGKGLHVCAPLDGRASWDEVKTFCHSIAADMERDAPDLYTANMRKDRRVGRIFVDYLRNGRGATAIAPYSPRARADAPVSVPLRWDEIDEVPTWTVLTLHERLRDADPWATWFDTKQGLGKPRARRRAAAK